MLKEQCVKFPSGSSEISWFLNEDSGPMMMMMMIDEYDDDDDKMMIR